MHSFYLEAYVIKSYVGPACIRDPRVSTIWASQVLCPDQCPISPAYRRNRSSTRTIAAAMPLGSLFKRTLKKKKGASSGIGEAASEAAAPAASDAAAPGTGGTARKRPAAGMSDPVASDLDAIMRAGGSAIVGPEAWRVGKFRKSAGGILLTTKVHYYLFLNLRPKEKSYLH